MKVLEMKPYKTETNARCSLRDSLGGRVRIKYQEWSREWKKYDKY